jgi:LmbE family N-acetylglucosaminyl deacetylase
MIVLFRSNGQTPTAISQGASMTSIGRAAGMRLLGIFAHPDDEQGIGATFTRAVDQGAKAYLVCATRGEAGQIMVEGLATPETLGAVRTAELELATSLLRWQPPIMLDYPDGGMHEVDLALIVDDLVRIIREIRPQVVVTFEKNGGYGHLDHITVHHAATEAFWLAGNAAYKPDLGRAWEPSKLYYGAIPRSFFLKMLASSEENPDIGGDRRTLSYEEMGTPDEEITTIVTARELIPTLRKSVLSHRTQFGEDWVDRFKSDEFEDWFGTNTFVRVHPAPLPNATLPDEHDLLTGLIG